MPQSGHGAPFSEFSVTNPKSGRTYRVAIRGEGLGENFCSCPDFAVNTLGTCKHVEWLLARLERKRGGKKAFKEGYHPAYSEVCLQYGAQRRVRFRAGTDFSGEARALVATYFDADGWLREGAHAEFDRFVRDAAKLDHEIRVYDDVLEFVARLRDDARRNKEIDRLFGGAAGKKALEGLLKVKLYAYQQEGALFAAKAGRCLIADDMGLGKTVQSIAAIEILGRTAGVQRVLVVCPTALKYQWKQEVERFANRSAVVIDGLRPERERLFGADSFYKIINYDTIQRDLDIVNGWMPDAVILDEAQRIKNWETKRAKCVKQIQANHALVLTGTPLENRLSELHSIMEFVDQFHLGPLFRFLAEHQHTDDHGRVVGYRNLDRVKESLAPVLIRRRKQDVLQQLPERTDKHLFVDMTEPQRIIHEENRDVVAKLVMKWRRWNFLSEADQRRLMVALQYMRMSCNSTFLVDQETDHGPKMDECCLLLDDILATPDQKVVVFSQWLRTHELLIRRLDTRKQPYAFYHGSLDSKARRGVVERFKSDPDCRVLLCTDSGGVGLNLQAASAVINMDQPWNPAVLEQRIGRVHRLGQHRNVQVFNFVSRDTIEHSMLDVLKFKTSMFAGVLDGGESEVFLSGAKAKRFMETVEEVSTHIPEHVPTVEETVEPEPVEEAPATPTAPTPAEVTWGVLLNAGLEFLGKLNVGVPGGVKQAGGTSLAALVAHDKDTGKPELRIPLPDADTAQKLGQLLSGLGQILGELGRR